MRNERQAVLANSKGRTVTADTVSFGAGGRRDHQGDLPHLPGSDIATENGL
jgi:hypothetical protein